MEILTGITTTFYAFNVYNYHKQSFAEVRHSSVIKILPSSDKMRSAFTSLIAFYAYKRFR